jgi:hypothetical protein
VITVRECRFRAIVALDPPAAADCLRRLLDAARRQCVLQACGGRWFPVTVSVRGSPSHGRPVRTVVRVRLLAGEPEAFFAAGQPFTLWADAIVGDRAVRGEGRLGDGVILGQISGAGETPRTSAGQALTYRRTVPQPRRAAGAPLMAGRQ